MSKPIWCALHSLPWVVCGSGQKACFSLDCIDDKTNLTSGANNGGWSRTNKSLDYIDGNTNFTSGKTNGGLVKYVNAAFTLYPQQIVLFSILTTGVIQD